MHVPTCPHTAPFILFFPFLSSLVFAPGIFIELVLSGDVEGWRVDRRWQQIQGGGKCACSIRLADCHPSKGWVGPA